MSEMSRNTRYIVTGIGLSIVCFLAAWSNIRIRDAIIGFVLMEDTEYATGYSESGFVMIRPGMSIEDVQGVLGAPLGENWYYPSKDKSECQIVFAQSASIFGASQCEKLGFVEGMSKMDVTRLLGAPPKTCAAYTGRGARDTHYRVRAVCFSNGRVTHVIREWYFD